MMAFISQKSLNFKTVILGRVSQLRPLYPIGYEKFDIHFSEIPGEIRSKYYRLQQESEKVFSLYLTAYLKVEPDQQAEKIVVAAGARDVQILLVQEIQSVLVHVRHLP